MGWIENVSNYNSYGWVAKVALTITNMKNTISFITIILSRGTDSKIINGGSGKRIPWVEFFKKLTSAGSMFIRESKVFIHHHNQN